VAGYTWYHFSGAKKLVQAANQTEAYYKEAKKKVAQKTPEPDEAFGWLRDTAKSYASFVPGAKSYVDTAFDDLEKIRRNQGKEFDDIVKDAYADLRDVSKKGRLDVDTACKIRDILEKHFKRLYELAGVSAEDILDNHPELKEKFGGSFDKLKEMGSAYGPQAQEEVDKTWKQVKDIVSNGVNTDTVEKIQKVAKEKEEKLRKLGDEAWKRGMDEVQPYLEKNPKIKELIEKNTDALKKGNFTKVWGLVKESSSSGNTEELEKYVKDTANQAKESGFGNLDKLSNMVPGGSNILSQLQSLQNAAEKKGPEAEKLLKETINDLQGVLSSRMKEAEKLAEETKSES
jgi:cell division septum initiation protein DivIVA